MKICTRWMGAAFAASLIAIGCSSDSSMTKAEMDSVKHSPPMTDADRAKVSGAMAAGAETARRQESDWATKNPAKLAEINAERAKMGRPPLGN